MTSKYMQRGANIRLFIALNYLSRRSNNSSDINMSGVLFECFYYRNIIYFIADCEYQVVNKEYAKKLKLKKEALLSKKFSSKYN